MRRYVQGVFGVLLLLAPIGCGPVPPSEAEQALQEGNAAFEQMNVREAMAYYDRALQLDSTNADAYLARGRARWMLNQHAQALPDLDRALHLDPSLTWAHYYRGGSRMMTQDFEGGVRDLRVVTETDELPHEDMIRAHRLHGVGLMNLERYPAAIEAFSHVIGLQPDVPVNYLDRAQLYEAVGQPRQALADYERALTLLPDGEAKAEEVQAHIRALRAEVEAVPER